MKSFSHTYLLFITLLLTTFTARAALVWDTVNNTATDSRVIGFNTPGTTGINDLQQFNSAAAVAAGAAAGEYVLTSVVLTITGSGMSGTFQFNNTFATPGTIYSANYAAGQGLTFAVAGVSVVQTMSHTFNGGNPYVLAGNTSMSEPFTPTLGAVGATTVTTGLDAFTGDGYLASSSANLAAQMSSSQDAGIFAGSLASGTANLSLTYHYELIPEPTSMALLGLGCAVLCLRRRRTSIV